VAQKSNDTRRNKLNTERQVALASLCKQKHCNHESRKLRIMKHATFV